MENLTLILFKVMLMMGCFNKNIAIDERDFFNDSSLFYRYIKTYT
ncbi:hypothetical protein KP78_15350 [Jeotgalibacillus soli]|uniref:Uncharacterized protein n=1 Tax=Jeotgalibacillus soli TaxID=889306 RepID=A0A0C2REC0_9BACL|nr:hypothetical protein KP78_15350 [Jeotgalibacillus soli]